MRKTLILVCAVILLTASGLQATPVACASLSDQTFAGLEAAGSCTIGDKVYDNFTLNGSLAASAVHIDQIIDMGNAQNGFLFGFGGLTATFTGVQTKDVRLGFDVTVLGKNTITSAHLTQFGSGVGGGDAGVDETVCLGGDIIGCPVGKTKIMSTDNPFGSSSASLTFGGVTELGVFKDIFVDASNGGRASISALLETVDQSGGSRGIPEPGFYGVLAGGLAGIFMLAKRRKKTV